MSAGLPGALKDGTANIIQNVSPSELKQRSAALSEAYRRGTTSDHAIRDDRDIAAYLATRLPATYAAIAAALRAVKERIPRYEPKSLLDAGAGPGTASWAAAETWPSLEAITMLDCNPRFLSTARELAAASNVPALQRAQLIDGDITSELASSYEVIIAGYAFSELSAAGAERALTALLDACRAIVVIVEPGTPAGFARILAARKLLLRLDATILAPCPGGYPCPMTAPAWCHFAERLPRSRAHVRAKGVHVPFEDEKFSYLAVARGRADLAAVSGRIVGQPHATKVGLTMQLCTAQGIIERQVLKRDKAAYKSLARKKWGDAL